MDKKPERRHVAGEVARILRRSRLPTSAQAASFLFAATLGPLTATAAQLPIQCTAGKCGTGGPNVWLASGNATSSVTADTLRINQTTPRATLNWSSFDVSADGHVIFQQPDASSIALNRIYQQSPSQIFGSIQANGQIYLVNPNGIVFGSTASVNAAGILASTLKISDTNFAAGLLSPDILNGKLSGGQHLAALEADGLDNNGNPLVGLDGQPLKVSLILQQGARLTAADGGRVLLAGQDVQNAGAVVAQNGQVILAAGQKAYLATSSDPALRGILVEVDGGGTVTNQVTGKLQADHGAVTMVGLAVNQEGRISASTSVTANGSVYLIAGDHVAMAPGSPDPKIPPIAPTVGGQVIIGGQSQIDVSPDLADTHTAVADQKQLPPTVDVSGGQIYFRSGASITAHGGSITARSIRNSSPDPNVANYDPTAKIHVESGVTLDVSGSDVTLPMSSNFVTVELRGNELANFPVQRNGALRGQTVVVDTRAAGKRADGTAWVGTPVGDVTATIAAMPQNIAQRTSKGGNVTFDSTGDLSVATGAAINVSGGVTTYTGGIDPSSQLITSSGRLVGIANADPNAVYLGVLQRTVKVVHDRWGVIQTFAAPFAPRYIPEYQQGANAGTVQFAAPSMVLDPTLLGSVVRGPYQRNPGAVAGGTLIIGSPNGQSDYKLTNDYQAPSIEFTRSNAPFAISDGATLPQSFPLTLSTGYLQNGFTSTQIYSNGAVKVPQGTGLTLPDGSTLQVTARGIDILDDVTAPGGTLSFNTILPKTGVGLPTASELVIGPGVTLDVRGTWTNDLPNRSTGILPTSAVAKNGGNITLKASAIGGSLAIGDGSQFRASGGAWLSTAGKLGFGTGGNVTLAVNPQATLHLGSNLGVDSFGVGGAAGGSLTLSVPRMTIAPGSQWLGPLSEDPTSVVPSVVRLGDGLFSQYGFSQITLTANGLRAASGSTDVLTVEPNTQIDALSRTLTLAPGRYSSQASDSNVAAFSSVGLLPSYQRGTMAVTLQAITDSGLTTALSLANGTLSVGSGANITADPRSTITLASVGGVDVEGRIYAPGGHINLTTLAPIVDLDLGYVPGLLVKVGSGSVLDVSGTSLFAPTDSTHPLLGTVLDGGSISLTANRGAIDVQQGSRLNASGTAALIDQPQPGSKGYVREVVGSAGGSVSLLAAEGLSFAGSLNAAAGAGQTGVTPGGSLSVSITRDFVLGNADLRSTFPTAPRILRIFDSAIAPVVTNPNGSPSGNGLALLDSALLHNSGIDSLRVMADNQVQIDAGVSLSLGKSMVFETPQIGVLGNGAVAVSSPYVEISNKSFQRSAGAATSGGGALNVTSARLNLIGSMSLQQIYQATLASTGDIQLTGNLTSSGMLATAGGLTLRGNRIYPSSGSSFTLQAGGPATDANVSTVRLEQAGDASVGTPLSAAGAVTINAGYIVQNSSLLAPFGTIALNASHKLQLGEGSVTSVSANGAVIPYGIVQNGNTWLYDTGAATIPTITGIPARQITLSAPAVSTAATSTVDISGGGDLYAYEFVPGTGGNKDALQPGAIPGLYAVLPSLRGQYAPLDPQNLAGSSLQPGMSVYLSGAPGLPAGIYPLLPATYGLLPGAFLVNAVPDTNGLAPGSTLGLPDGTPVVAGYRTFGQTGIGDALYSGFAIRAAGTGQGSYAHNLAQYDDHLASSYFAKLAAAKDQRAPALPADAARLTVAVTSALNLAGAVKTAAATGGTGGQIEIVAPKIEVAAAGVAASDPAAVVVSDAQLQNLNPSRLVLGGQQSADSSSIAVTSTSVHFGKGTQLTVDELIAVATQDVTLDGGSRVASTSGTSGRLPAAAAFKDPVKLTLSNPAGTGAAALILSDSRRVALATPGATGGGAINVDSGSSVATRGSLVMSAPGGGAIQGAIEGAGAYWTLSAGQVVLGGAPGPNSNALGVTSALLASAKQARSLAIESGSTIDFAGSTDLTLPAGSAALPSKLTLVANGLRDVSAGARVAIGADTVEIDGLTTAAPAATSGAGALTITGGTIGFGAGSTALSGFAKTNFNASGDVVLSGASNLDVAGDLTTNTNRVNVAGTADAAWRVSGAFALAGPTASGGIPTALTPGGAFFLRAADVQLNGAIAAPSGSIAIQSAGNLAMSSTVSIDASGMPVSAGGRTLGTPGGNINLFAGGSMQLAAGSSLSVDGALDASAGSISIYSGQASSIGARLSGKAGPAAAGGKFRLVADSVGNFSSLIQNLQLGGFNVGESIHVARGDLLLAQGATANARTIEWSTDSGSIEIAGTIRADSGAERSRVHLSAGNSVTVGGTGVINADASNASARGGSIDLDAGTGDVGILRGAVLSARGSQSGDLTIRASASATDIGVSHLDGDFSGLAQVILEPRFTQTISDGSTIDAALSSLQGLATTFMNQNAAGIAARFSGVGNALAIRPAVQVLAQGDVTLNGTDLSQQWRFGSNLQPVDLIVRSAGTLTVAGTLSDGFVQSGRTLDLLSGPSSSISLVGGANLSAANFLSTVDDRANPQINGDLLLGTDGSAAIVRTGTGNISLAASRDIVFAPGSTVYTGGNPGIPTLPPQALTRTVVSFANGGGSVAAVAGRDVRGAEVSQSITDWAQRVGSQGRGATPPTPGQWGTNFQKFAWTFGALGGGDLNIAAGRDITNVAAASANSVGLDASAVLREFGGSSSLTLTAGRNVGSPEIYVGHGVGTITAGGSINSSRQFTVVGSDTSVPVGALLEVGDAQLTLQARGDVLINTAFNPHAIQQFNQTNPLSRSYFYTYGTDTSVSAQSVSGSVTLQSDLGTAGVFFGSQDPQSYAETIMPSSLALHALTGDIVLGNASTLFPSDSGQLDLFAGRDLVGSGTNSGITLPDAPDSISPRPLNPAAAGATLDGLAFPLGAGTGRHLSDPNPALISVGRDIQALAGNNVLTFGIAKPVEVAAGRDIVNLSLNNQNLRAGDLTEVSAGRDLVLTALNGQVTVGGPGRVDVLAGRNIELGLSKGITTVGRNLNPALSSPIGADLTVVAGLAQSLDAPDFVKSIVANSSNYQKMLESYVQEQSGTPGSSFQQASAAFLDMSADLQRPLLLDVFFNELLLSGREANTTPKLGYSRGFTAINTLFPGSGAGQTNPPANPYTGNISLAFSQIYTLAGGNVSIAAPGGGVDVGLAFPPASVIVNKLPSDLGIVAVGPGNVNVFANNSVEVNSSRIFTLGGGNILIWSTTGNIDAGKGAKSAVSAPPPVISVDSSGRVTANFQGAVTGSGIRTIISGDNVKAADVDLDAPNGFVDTGDAGIGASKNLNIAAKGVIGADNIQVGGTATGVPPATSGIAASLSGAANAGSSATSASNSLAADDAAKEAQAAPIAQATMSWLEVFVTGLGEDNCKTDDMECLKRQAIH